MASQLGRRPEDPDYGLGEHTFDSDALGLIDDGELTERLLRTFQSPDYRPPRLPAVATQLLSMSQDPDVEFEDIERLLEQDSALAGEMLSVARSAFYSGQRQVVSLREALVRLGLAKLRGVVMQAAMTARVFRSSSYKACMEHLQEHSRATAHLSRIVSSYTPIAEEHAFLCGLLHDVGIAGILLVLGDTQRGKQPPELNVLWPAIDAAHAEAGARMIEHWGLPAEIAMAVGAHHTVRIEGFDHPLAATVCLAEALTAELGMAFTPPTEEKGNEEADLVAACLADGVGVDRSDPVVVERSQEALALTETTMDLIRTAAQEWARSAQG